MISELAIVDPSAEIGSDVVIGPWSHIGANVVIGSNTVIGSHVIISGPTRIGAHNQIDSFSNIGGNPQHLEYHRSQCPLIIGNHNVIREYSSIHRGTPDPQGIQRTQIGDHNFLMAYSHVAHDCELGDHIIFANNASISGHVSIGNHVVLSGFVGIHQFCRIGAYAFLGRSAKVVQDIIPFTMVEGNPGAPCGLNRVGLRRAGFSRDQIKAVKNAYHLLFQEGLSLKAATEALSELAKTNDEVEMLVDFIKMTRRSLSRPRQRGLATT